MIVISSELQHAIACDLAARNPHPNETTCSSRVFFDSSPRTSGLLAVRVSPDHNMHARSDVNFIAISEEP